MAAARGPLTLDEIAQHPETANVIARYEPRLKGFASVAQGRSGGPISIAYEVYGNGPIHLVWIMGLNAPKISWHRQVKYFGVERRDMFTCLVFDNRGVGDSGVPWALRYTTCEMAKDALELCDHVGWTEKKQLHVVGVSMGGMIAQELAYAAPERIASLTLQSTAAALVSQIPWYQHLARRAYMIMPKTLHARLEATKRNIFSDSWLAAPDDLGVFPTNGDRFVSEELWRMKELKAPVYRGFLLQGLAATWHYMGEDRLKAIGSNVKHVLVCTGTSDQMIEYTHSDVLVAGISAGGVAEVKKRYFEGVGHALNRETLEEYNKMVEAFVTSAHQG
ncbi:Alpha/Beta hydrolase protein [Sphaerosporella brunnea]|uniref:Alpha/Beta hydrolase protein n=1 Tax=Sphaerosporella brunnea TaxID=1250544 RepID=A0A5J5FBC1_9PEZI|nr:Alpha/Beta hydrolase protein [Sphaerosporella brunnea]